MKRGFTLLELLISCTLLLVVLGVLSTVITRANALRSEGVRRTTLLTQGRAALDSIAEDLQSIIGTNLAVLAGAESYGSTNAGLYLMRTRAAPRNLASAEDMAPPIETIYYQVAKTNQMAESNAHVYFLYRGRTPYVAGDEPSTTNLGFTVTRQDTSGGSDQVTNIVAGSGITLIPSGQTGETIMLPVNSASSARIYDWTTSTAAWIDVVPTADPDTNRVVATVIFSNAFTIASVYAYAPGMTNIPAGFWPTSPLTTVATGYQALTFISTTNQAGVAGTFANTIPVNATNLVDAANQASFTNTWDVYQWSGTPPTSLHTNTFTGVQFAGAILGTTPVTNAWIIPPGTNAVAGVGAGAASFDWASWDTTATPIPALTNISWQVYSITNVNVFTNTVSTNSPIIMLPLSLYTTNISFFAINAGAFETMATNASAVLALGGTSAPLQMQSWWRTSETLSTNQVSTSNLVVTVWQRVQQVTTNILETLVPATLIATNFHYRYPDQLSIHDRVDAVRYNDTIWVPHTLTEDYGGGTADIVSLWLEHGERDRFDFSDVPITITGFVGSPLDEDEGAASADEVIDGVAKLYFQPLRFFRDSAEEPWRLEFWSPGNTEPPVCIDIYLELLDPRVARRAATLAENSEQQKAFVERNVVRLSRRVPLNPYNRWREP
jgi:hypothetical protein